MEEAMRRGSRLWLAALAALLLPAVLPAGALAQEQESGTPQMFFVHQEVVKPAMISEYEAAAVDFVAMLGESSEAAEKLQFEAFSGPQIGYLYVIPVDGFAGFGEVSGAFESIAESFGERWKEVGARSDAAVERYESGFYVHRSDMSYQPETPRLAEDEVRFVHWDFWYAIPGKAEALEEVAREFVALYKSKSLDTGWNVYQAVTGNDLPLYVVAVGARNEADFHANEARLNELAGKEAEALQQKALKSARRVEPMVGWMRPDISFPSQMALEAPDEQGRL